MSVFAWLTEKNMEFTRWLLHLLRSDGGATLRRSMSRNPQILLMLVVLCIICTVIIVVCIRWMVGDSEADRRFWAEMEAADADVNSRVLKGEGKPGSKAKKQGGAKSKQRSGNGAPAPDAPRPRKLLPGYGHSVLGSYGHMTKVQNAKRRVTQAAKALGGKAE